MAADVKKLELGSVEAVDKPTESGRTIGHEFTVEAELTDIRNCKLEWWEKTDVPYPDAVAAGMTANNWFELYGALPNSEVFENWNLHVSTVPLGDVEVSMLDKPGIMVDETDERTLYFEIRVQEENQAGSNRQRRIRAKQTLKVDGTVIDFEILQNNQSGDVESGAPTW
jgi:hypothetical protein